MTCADKANAFVHWRRTIAAEGYVHSPGFVQYLPKIKISGSCIVYLGLVTGTQSRGLVYTANYLVPVRIESGTNEVDWSIVFPSHLSEPGKLQLEIRIRQGEVAFRLKNLSDTNLHWNTTGFLVLCEDKPLFVQVSGMGNSGIAQFYEPSRLFVPGLAELQAAVGSISDLDADLTAEIAARIAGDTFGLARANHTGTQLASTISDFNAAARAQTEAELVAGTNITITPAGAGATRTLTLASAPGGGVSANIDLMMYAEIDGSKFTASSIYPQISAQVPLLGGWEGGWITNGINNGWIKVELPFAMTAKSYAVTPWSPDTFPARSFKNWTFEGSNDNVAWTVLDTKVGYIAWIRYQRNLFATANVTAYKWYRWNVTLNGGDTYMGCSRLWLYGQPS